MALGKCERRVQQRFPLFRFIRFEGEGQSGVACSLDVSQDGSRILLPRAMAPGSSMQLSIPLSMRYPSRGRMPVRARVAWTTRRAIGVRFDQPSAGFSQAMHRLLRHYFVNATSAEVAEFIRRSRTDFTAEEARWL